MNEIYSHIVLRLEGKKRGDLCVCGTLHYSLQIVADMKLYCE